MLEKYPDLNSDRSRSYLRNAFRVGLKNEALVLARKEGDYKRKSSFHSKGLVREPFKNVLADFAR